jgi:hypothetical protein
MMVLGSFQVVQTASSSFMGSRATDSIIGFDAYNAYTANDNAALLSTPISGYGETYYSSDQYDQYKVAVSNGDEVTIHFIRSASTSYIDLYFYNQAKTRVLLQSNVKDFTYTITATGNGYVYFAVDFDSSVDNGNYWLDVSSSADGGGGVEDGGELTDGVGANGHMDSTDGSDMWYIDVGANAESMYVILVCGSSDFDTYGRFGAEPTTSIYDWRGYTSGGEENTVSSPAQGRHYIMVDWYSGDDDYTLTATITYAAGDTTPPSVSITAPSNGATVSGTVTISFTASDANGISSRAIKIDGTTVSTGSSYSWDTTAYSDAAHTIRCEATDPSSNTGYAQISVTVDNYVPPVDNDMGTGVDAYDSYGASDSATLLSTPASGTGTIDLSSDQYDQFKVAVSANDEVTISFTAPSGATGLDVPVYDTTKTAFWTKSNVGSFTDTVTASGNGYVYITIDADASSDTGTYSMSVSVSGGTPPDTTPPTVSITNPANGATVSGTVSISFSASDANGISSRAIKIDGSTVSTGSSFSWDTTGYSNGAHTIVCEATDPSSNTGSDTHTVTVDNGGGGGNVLTSGVPVTGSLAAQGATEMWTMDVGSNMISMRGVLTCGSADFDLYGRLGAEPTTSTYDWRGYTSGGEDVTFPNPGAGTWYIMVRSYSGTGAYELTVTLTEGGSSSWGTGGKYAILVGISDYQSISDLSYCDEDATDWYNFLNGQGYECHVYGDGHTSNYPVYTGTAYESTVRAAVQELANHAQAGDKVLFITSGHGAGDGNGNSYLCMYDCSGSAGCYYDTELAADMSGFDTGVEIMVFIDHCYSGGMGPELMSLSQQIYCTTTCTEDGYGYDDPTHQNGAWTYEYLERYWVGNPTASAESIYDSASATYPHTGGDACMEFDGFSGSFYI